MDNIYRQLCKWEILLCKANRYILWFLWVLKNWMPWNFVAFSHTAACDVPCLPWHFKLYLQHHSTVMLWGHLSARINISLALSSDCFLDYGMKHSEELNELFLKMGFQALFWKKFRSYKDHLLVLVSAKKEINYYEPVSNVRDIAKVSFHY